MRPISQVVRIIGKPLGYMDGPIRDGVISVVAMDDNGDTSRWVSQRGLGQILVSAISLAREIQEKFDIHRITASFKGGSRVLVESYDGVWVAVRVKKGHPVNKVIGRIMRGAARRAGLKKVDSSPQHGQPPSLGIL